MDKIVDQCGLSRNHDTSLRAVERVAHVGHRLAIGPLLETESGIGA